MLCNSVILYEEKNIFFSCYEFIVVCLTIHQEPEPFYFWRVVAGAAENRAAPQLCIQRCII